MGIKNVVKRVGDKAGNRVAKLAALSSGQVEEIQLQRENIYWKNQIRRMNWQ